MEKLKALAFAGAFFVVLNFTTEGTEFYLSAMDAQKARNVLNIALFALCLSLCALWLKMRDSGLRQNEGWSSFAVKMLLTFTTEDTELYTESTEIRLCALW